MPQRAKSRGPFRLVSVNTTSERAKRLIGRMVEAISSHYDINHVANCSNMFTPQYTTIGSLTRSLAIDQVALTVRQHHLFSASMWTAKEAAKIQAIAERERPSIKTHALPLGLQVERGPDTVVKYLIEVVPGLLDEMKS